MALKRGGTGKRLDGAEQQRGFEQVVLDNMQSLDEMQHFGLAAARAVYHAVEVVPVVAQYLFDDRGVGPCRGEHQFTHGQILTRHLVGEFVFPGVDQIRRNVVVETLWVFRGQVVGKYVVPG